MDLFEAIAKRHSYRGEFTDAQVPRKDLQKIVQAGIQAPSAKNEQVVTFVAVDEPRLLQQIVEIVDNRPVCRTAKAMIACVVDPRPVLGDVSYAVEDCAAAVENILLAITASGLRERVARQRTAERRTRRARGPIARRSGRAIGSRPPAPGRAGPAGHQRERLPFYRRAWFNQHGE